MCREIRPFGFDRRSFSYVPLKISQLFAVAIALCLFPIASDAQARTTFAMDAAVGAGSARGGEFFDRDLIGARLAGSIRRLSPSGIGVFGEIAADWPSIRSGEIAICYESPRGGCVQSYPTLSGTTAIVGVIARHASWLEGQVGVGGGSLSGVFAAITASELIVFPVHHVGILAGFQWIAVPSYHGDRLGVVQSSFGLRIR